MSWKRFKMQSMSSCRVMIAVRLTSITCCSSSRSMAPKTVSLGAARPIRTWSMSCSTFTSRRRIQRRCLRFVKDKRLFCRTSQSMVICGSKLWPTSEIKTIIVVNLDQMLRKILKKLWRKSGRKTSCHLFWSLKSSKPTKIFLSVSWSLSCLRI